MKLMLKTLMIYIVTLPIALAQTSDNSAGAESTPDSERARLANQRIQAEAEMRAREEQRRLEEAEQARLRAAEEAAVRSDLPAVPPSRPVASGADDSGNMLRTLEQLRLLGELRDDGYVTEDEFTRIKQKILDSQL